MAAVSAKTDNTVVTVIERNEDILKKLCLTGNGRCNFSNSEINYKYYNFDKDHPFCKILEEYDSEWLEGFFKENGMLSITKDGLKYPRSEKAETVKEILTSMAKQKEIDLLLSRKVTSVKKENDVFVLTLDNSEKTECDRLIITTGGKAYPSTGSDGAGYRLARELGHRVTYTYPALTRLFTDDREILKLAGVRYKAMVTGIADGKVLDRQYGEIQFTEKGLSGICIFKLSSFMSKPLEDKEKCSVIIDFLPEMTKEEMIVYLGKMLAKQQKNVNIQNPDHAKETIKEILIGMVGEKPAKMICNKAEKLYKIEACKNNETCNENKNGNKEETVNDTMKDRKTEIEHLAGLIKNLEIPITEHDSFSGAQVTRGGVDTGEVDDGLGSKKCQGLFFAGEVLDVDGTCGGYNLHWAFASGFKAGKSSARD